MVGVSSPKVASMDSVGRAVVSAGSTAPVAKEMDCSLSRRVFSFRTPRTVMMPHRKIIKISSSATVPPWLFGGSVRPVPYTLSSQG